MQLEKETKSNKTLTEKEKEAFHKDILATLNKHGIHRACFVMAMPKETEGFSVYEQILQLTAKEMLMAYKILAIRAQKGADETINVQENLCKR
jgi:hypothetical protein